MERYFGNYRGIVISNADPKELNRVKVFVPQISTTLLERVNLKKEDLLFRGIGNNAPGALPQDVVDAIEPLLPWAEYAAPLFGGGSSTLYNPDTKQATNTSGTAYTPPAGGGTVGNYLNLGAPGNVQPAPHTPNKEYHRSKDQGVYTKIAALGSNERRNLEIFVTAIGYSESGWNVAEAYRDICNRTTAELRSMGYSEDKINKIKNRNVEKNQGKLGLQGAREEYGDYGFLQTNRNQTRSENFQGDPRDINGIGLDSTSRASQLNAGIEYLRVNHPKGYSAAAQGDFETARQLCQGVWFGLKDKANDPTFRSILSGQSNATQEKWLGIAKDTTSIDLKEALAAGAAKDAGKRAQTSPVRGDKAATSLGTVESQNTFRPANDLADRNYATPLEGIPGGMFSTPMVGSHVWVFFEGGDPLYPVYFAQHIVADDMSRAKQASSAGAKTDVTKAKQRTQVSQIMQPGAGSLEMITQVWHDDVEGDVEESGFRISCKNGGIYEKMSSGTVDYSPRAKSSTTDGNEFHSVYGYQQEYVAGANFQKVGEDYVLEVGRWDETAQKAASDIYSTLEPIHNARRNRIVPTGTAPCPNCNRSILSTKGDSLISRVLRVARKAIDKVLPKKGVAQDVITDILTVSLRPIKSVKQKTVMSSSSCGPTCTNHRVDTYTGPGSTQGDEEFVGQLETVQNEIQTLEKQTGFGGDLKIKVARNAALIVGLAPNILEPFKELKNGLLVLNGVEMYKGQGSMGFKSDGVSQHVPMEMVTPDMGNYDMLIGNKLNIKSGGGGIFVETTGQLNLHGGTIEMTGKSLVLGNNEGITKINGKALQIYGTSIQLGEAATNVHVLGSMHCSSNLNTMGAIYSQGGLATAGLDIPYEVEKTSTSANPDWAGESALWLTTGASIAKGVSTSWKSLLHWGNPGQIGYLATTAGMNDFMTETMTAITQSLPFDGLTGIGFGIGVVAIFNFPHLHTKSANAHYHSYERPRGTKLGGLDTAIDTYAMNGTATPNVVGMG